MDKMLMCYDMKAIKAKTWCINKLSFAANCIVVTYSKKCFDNSSKCKNLNNKTCVLEKEQKVLRNKTI